MRSGTAAVDRAARAARAERETVQHGVHGGKLVVGMVAGSTVGGAPGEPQVAERTIRRLADAAHPAAEPSGGTPRPARMPDRRAGHLGHELGAGHVGHPDWMIVLIPSRSHSGFEGRRMSDLPSDPDRHRPGCAASERGARPRSATSVGPTDRMIARAEMGDQDESREECRRGCRQSTPRRSGRRPCRPGRGRRACPDATGGTIPRIRLGAKNGSVVSRCGGPAGMCGGRPRPPRGQHQEARQAARGRRIPERPAGPRRCASAPPR